MPKTVITVDDIRNVLPGATLPVPAGAVVTDLARELAQANQISLVAEEHQINATPE